MESTLHTVVIVCGPFINQLSTTNNGRIDILGSLEKVKIAPKKLLWFTAITLTENPPRPILPLEAPLPEPPAP